MQQKATGRVRLRMVFSHLSSACKKSLLLQLARSNHELNWTNVRSTLGHTKLITCFSDPAGHKF